MASGKRETVHYLTWNATTSTKIGQGSHSSDVYCQSKAKDNRYEHKINCNTGWSVHHTVSIGFYMLSSSLFDVLRSLSTHKVVTF